MNDNKWLNTQRYLTRYDYILSEMTIQMFPILTNNITIDFINCMIPHHQAAVYMCQNLLNNTNYHPLQQIANNIIKTQTNGIKQMKQIKRTAPYFYNHPKDINSYIKAYTKITKTMIYKMQNSQRSNNINLDFISEMIPHHEGAIYMCHNLLKYNIDPRLKEIAKNIIKEQSIGIKQLKKIQTTLYNQNK